MKTKTIPKLILVLLVCLVNFWIWRVLSESLLLGVALVTLSIFLVFRIKFLSVITFIVLSVFLLKNTFDTNLLYVSPLEKDKLTNRFEYYAKGLGKIYRNRIGVSLHYEVTPYLFKFQRNLFYNLDPNLYFFVNHPRERLGIDEFSKFSLLVLPFFFIGFTQLLIRPDRFLIFYLGLAVILSAFIFPGYNLGPVLMFPFVVALIHMGLSKTVKRLI